MAKVSLNQAAKDTGVSLPTLSRWRKSGKITAEKNGSGGYIMDTSEYDRIKELKKQSPNMKRNERDSMKEVETHVTPPNETGTLKVEVEVLRERIKDKDSLLDELREDRDDWKKQAQTLLLQSPINHNTTENPTKPETVNLKVKHPEFYVIGLAFSVIIILISSNWYFSNP